MLKIILNPEDYKNCTREELLTSHKRSYELLKNINTVKPIKDNVNPIVYREKFKKSIIEDLEFIESVLKDRKISIPNYNNLIWKVRDNKYVKGINNIFIFIFTVSLPVLAVIGVLLGIIGIITSINELH